MPTYHFYGDSSERRGVSQHDTFDCHSEGPPEESPSCPLDPLPGMLRSADSAQHDTFDCHKAGKDTGGPKESMAVEEANEAVYEELVPDSIEGMRRTVVGEAFDRVIDRLQPAAKILGPFKGHDLISIAVMDADRRLNPRQMVNGRDGVEGILRDSQFRFPAPAPAPRSYIGRSLTLHHRSWRRKGRPFSAPDHY